MLSAIYHGKKDIRVKDVREPFPQGNQVKVKIKYAGICGSDLSCYENGSDYIKEGIVLGHEFVGEIVDIGGKVDNREWQTGTKVAVMPYTYCSRCIWCGKGKYNLCENPGINGLTIDGGFSKYICVENSQLFKLGRHTSFERGVLIEPFASAIHSIHRSNLIKNESVAVVGLGTLGLATISVLMKGGCKRVFAVGKYIIGREMAEKLGVSESLDSMDPDLKKKIRSDLTFECAGSEDSLRMAIGITERGGRIVVSGIHGRKTNVNMLSMVLLEKSIIGSFAYTREDFNGAVSVVEANNDIEPLITKKISLSDIVKEGFEELLNNKGRHIKVIVSPE